MKVFLLPGVILGSGGEGTVVVNMILENWLEMEDRRGNELVNGLSENSQLELTTISSRNRYKNTKYLLFVINAYNRSHIH